MDEQHNYLLPSYKTEAKVSKRKLQKTQLDIKNTVIRSKNTKIYTKGISSSAFQRAWAEGYTGKGIVVAIIDTGVDSSHPDLQNKIIQSINLTDESVEQDHGTHVAGTIAANGYLIGGAYDCKLIDIKALGKTGGSINNVVKGIRYAAANKAHIINMSLGAANLSSSDINLLTSAISDAWNSGTICVAACGNDGVSVCTPDQFEYPASIEKVSSISACDIGNDLNTISLAPFSNENTQVDMGACGTNVLSTIRGGNYGILSGTSMATPHVSAMAALLGQYILSKYPTMSGSSFSTNLVSLLRRNVCPVDGCGTQKLGLSQQTTHTSSIFHEKFTNISFGLGFLRYEPTNGPYTPSGTPLIYNGIFVGHTV